MKILQLPFICNNSLVNLIQTYKSYQKTRNCKNLLQFLHTNCTNCGDPDPREEEGSKALGEGCHGPIDPQEDK